MGARYWCGSWCVLGAALGGVPGGAAGAVAGGVAGAGLINTSRAFIDSGSVRNPYTHEYGVSAHDFFINNLGSFKSYRVHPSTDLFNQMTEKQEFSDVRSYHTKNLRWALENTQEPGDRWDEQARGLVKDIYSTFYEEYPDEPVLRLDKFKRWLTPHMGALGRVAALRGASATDIKRMIDRFSDNADMTGQQLEYWRAQLVNLLKKEQLMRITKNIRSILSANRSTQGSPASFARPNIF